MPRINKIVPETKDVNKTRVLAEKKSNSPQDVIAPKSKKSKLSELTDLASSSNTTGKKGKAGTKTSAPKKAGKKPKLKNPMNCVPECLPGARSGCCQKSGRRLPGMLTCVEVFKLLTRMGVDDCSRVSKCMMAGLARGHIKLPEGGDLDSVIYELHGEPGIDCRHLFKITLRMLLNQEDGPGNDEGGSVVCENFVDGSKGCQNFGVFLTQICGGKPRLEPYAKFHNHCTGCPGFGRCLGDYRNECRVNKQTGEHFSPRFVGASGIYTSDEESDAGGSDDNE